MPDIRPFRGILYDPARVSPADVVAPPYDVISPAEQAALYERHPANVVRLILGREADRYGAASRLAREWRREGILRRDDAPSLYILRQDAEAGGKTISRTGFIAACRLEDLGSGSILPHEKTLSKPKEDRFRLFRSTGGMFSQIFSLYSDPSYRMERETARIIASPARFDIRLDGVRHRLWSSADGELVRTAARLLAGGKVYVADGHHRYETALLHRDAARIDEPDAGPDAPFEFVPMYFTNMDDPGLAILPTHRIVHSLPGFDAVRLLESLAEYFDIRAEGGTGEAPHAFGVAVGNEERRIIFRRPDALRGIPRPLAGLDVTILHEIVMKRILGMSEEDQALKKYLDYTIDAPAAVGRVRSGEAQAAFLLEATRVGQLREAAEAGLTMPQKSTYFYPKLLSGLVSYSFRES